MIISPFKQNNKSLFNPYFDNSNRIIRILYRLKSYSVIFRNAINKGISISDLMRAQFPFIFSDAKEPPIVSIEFTNHCNLKCLYCTNHLGLRKSGFMNDIVFDKILNDLSKMKSNRIQLVGNGESTLHPKFDEYTSKLAKTGNYLSLVTNGQWEDINIAEQILKAPLDLVEISIDAGGKDIYEASRINASYDILLSNLEKLITLKGKIKSKILIIIRLMIRPSQEQFYQSEIGFWRKYCDYVMPQYITKINNTEYQKDLFYPIQNNHDDFPKCSLPFKHLEIKYTGDVLMCYYSLFQIGTPGLMIGNILNSSITDIWNSKIMKNYRNAHRKKLKTNMPVCKSCPGT